jgi:uncharacterized membrane protein YvbJ
MMSDEFTNNHTKKLPKVKKTLGDLLDDGQVKTGKAVLDAKAQEAKEAELFLAAAQEEERMRRFRSKRPRGS